MSDAAPDNRSRTILLAGLAVVALGALVAFVLVPLLTGSDEPEDDTEVVVVDPDNPDPTTSPTEDFELADPDEVDEGDPPAETFEVFNARDPFQQLVDDSTAGGDATGDGSPTGGLPPTDPGTTPGTPGTPPGVTPDPSTTPPPGTSPGTTPPPDSSDGSGGSDGSNGSDGNGDGDGNGSDAQVGGTQVTLVDVFTDDDGERQATVTVNGTGYTVGEGETFGRRFRLLDISGSCATMLFGDSRFTLCEGERIRK